MVLCGGSMFPLIFKYSSFWIKLNLKPEEVTLNLFLHELNKYSPYPPKNIFVFS